jgi:hypothetical protein
MPRNQTSYWASKPAYLFSCWTWIFGDRDWLAHNIIHGLLEWYWPSAHKLGCHSQCAYSDWRLKFTNLMPAPIMRITRIFSKKISKCCFLIFSVCCPLLCAAYTLKECHLLLQKQEEFVISRIFWIQMKDFLASNWQVNMSVSTWLPVKNKPHIITGAF